MSTPGYKCLTLTVLERKNSGEAMALLQRIADQVEPIMAKRCWTVGVLGEICPKKKSKILGQNFGRGETIHIRIRDETNPDTFMDYEGLVCTMLHELAHIIHSPHNSEFWALYETLKAETEELIVHNFVGGYLKPVVREPRSAPSVFTTGRVHQLASMPSSSGRVEWAGHGRRLGTVRRSKTLTPAAAAYAAALKRAEK